MDSSVGGFCEGGCDERADMISEAQATQQALGSYSHLFFEFLFLHSLVTCGMTVA